MGPCDFAEPVRSRAVEDTLCPNEGILRSLVGWTGGRATLPQIAHGIYIARCPSASAELRIDEIRQLERDAAREWPVIRIVDPRVNQ